MRVGWSVCGRNGRRGDIGNLYRYFFKKKSNKLKKNHALTQYTVLQYFIDVLHIFLCNFHHLEIHLMSIPQFDANKDISGNNREQYIHFSKDMRITFMYPGSRLWGEERKKWTGDENSYSFLSKIWNTKKSDKIKMLLTNF